MNTETHVMSLPCELTEDELLDRGQELSEAVKELAIEQDKEKKRKKEAKDRENEMQARIDKLATIRRTGREDRAVDVQDQVRWATRRVVTIRLDTREQVKSRPMSQSEVEQYRQGDLLESAPAHPAH